MKRVIILGAGASITEGLNKDLWERIKGKDVWSCNSMFKIMPYLPSRQLWVDSSFVESDLHNMQKLHQQGVPLHCKRYHRLAMLENKIHQYNTTREPDKYYGRHALDPDKNVIYYGEMGLCGMFSLALAIAEHYDEIFLLGFDFGSPGLDQKYTHVYQSRLAELNITSTGAGRPDVYLMPEEDPNAGKTRPEMSNFELYAKTEGVKIWNVSMISHIPYFDKITYDQFFEKINAPV